MLSTILIFMIVAYRKHFISLGLMAVTLLANIIYIIVVFNNGPVTIFGEVLVIKDILAIFTSLFQYYVFDVFFILMILYFCYITIKTHDVKKLTKRLYTEICKSKGIIIGLPFVLLITYLLLRDARLLLFLVLLTPIISSCRVYYIFYEYFILEE